MPRQSHTVGNHDMVSQLAVMGNVRIGHQKIMTTDAGRLAFVGCPINRHTFANLIMVADQGFTGSPGVFQVLGFKTNRCPRKNAIVLAQGCMAFNHDIRCNERLSPNDNMRSDHGMGPHLHRRMQFSLGMHYRCRVNARGREGSRHILSELGALSLLKIVTDTLTF